MNCKHPPLVFAILTISVLFISGCKMGADEAPFAVSVRLQSEPDNLHPVFSRSSYSTQIESLILLPAAEFDPVSQELSPLLLEEIPKAEKITTGKYAGGLRYDLQIRKEAEWEDGVPVTSEDYLFTIKFVYNPHVSVPVYRSLFDFIAEIELDPNDPKHLQVYLDTAFLLSTEVVTNINIYPSHIYDPKQIMNPYSLAQLRDPEASWTPEQDSLMKNFATEFESVTFFRENVKGSGPYTLDAWNTGEFIRLKRKTDWWGDKLENPPLLLQAYPDEITYRIILDPTAAEAALKAGELDVLAELPADDYVRLRDDPAMKDKFQFETPQLMQINFVELNTRDSILADIRVRQALASVIDYESMVSHILKGLGGRAIGPIHPAKSYFDKNLKPTTQDVNKSIALLQAAGWKDTNGNGTPDKIIGGKTEELSLTIKIENKEEGSTIANIIKENAAKAGFDIQIEVVESGQYKQDRRQRNFEIVLARTQSFPQKDDPYQFWHSSSDRAGGPNLTGFHTTELDSVLLVIRTAENEDIRNNAYRRFQEIIFEAVPRIYLYAPYEKIVASKRVKLVTTSRRPGYFENLLRPAG